MSGGKHLAILVPTLDGGGAERVMLYIVPGLARLGYRIDLVVCRAQGHLRDRLPPEARLVELERSSIAAGRLNALASDPAGFLELARPMLFPIKSVWALRYGASLTAYLKREQPDILLSGGQYFNLVALWARRRAAVATRVAITEHTVLTPNIEARPGHWRHQYLPPLLRRTYPWADAIISVSRGVGDDLAKITGLARARITTIYNPVVSSDMAALAEAPLDHPWFDGGGGPALLAAGRLVFEKDFPTLLRAFARVRKARDAKLIILGSGGKLGSAVDDLVKRLDLTEHVAFEGWVENPFAYMSRASVFVLSSLYEGLGNVLIEAMACGCPVVSTDCPSGPAEILAKGHYGPLVPVGDDAAMAEAILGVLDEPIDAQVLKDRADDFTVEKAVAQYQAVFQDLTAPPSA
ncbi:MAG: glycosyltransferase [Pseudomonadota bacterium]